jgi:DNA-binding beta-propeller fold protein YncE
VNRPALSFFLRPSPTGLLLASVLLAAWAPLAAQRTASAPPGGNGTFYISTYTDQIRVIDERTRTVTGQIQTQNGIPGGFVVSANRERLYVSDATFDHIETIDLAERRSIDSFTIREGNAEFKIRNFAIDPQERYALIVGRTRIKHIDRFEIGPNIILRYDLQRHEIMDTIPWPGGHERQNARFMFSPDGSLVYFSAEDMIVLESENFTEVDRWEVSQELEPGLGRVRPSFTTSYFEEPGFFTGLVRITDPINQRRMIGVARVDLAEKGMEFYTLGPSVPVGRFALAPDGTKAWAIYSEVGRYEFWAIDLEERRVTHRETIMEGRPRMGLNVSTNGELLYVHVAGNTIDIYDSETYEHLETVDVGGDMRGFILLPGPEAP